MIWVGVAVGGSLGELGGGMLDHHHWLGIWAIILSTLGSLIGVWAGYKVAKYYM